MHLVFGKNKICRRINPFKNVRVEQRATELQIVVWNNDEKGLPDTLRH